MCIVYMGYLILWKNNEDEINHMAIKLRNLGVDLEQKDTAARFLGFTLDLDEDTGFHEMKQVGLVKN